MREPLSILRVCYIPYSYYSYYVLYMFCYCIGPPWITRTESGIDINFIINANVPGIPVPTIDSGTGTGTTANALLASGIIRPGIIYACYTIDSNIDDAYSRLKEAGVYVVKESELLPSKWSFLLQKVVLYTSNTNTGAGDSLFLEDEDGNLLRLIASQEKERSEL